MDKQKIDGLSSVAWERLAREQNYLMQARVIFRQAGRDDDLVQMAFAENLDADDLIVNGAELGASEAEQKVASRLLEMDS